MFIYILIALAGAAAYVFHLFQLRQKRRVELESLVERRVKERNESIQMASAAAEKVPADVREKISSWDFQTLREELQSGSVSCLDVVRTYLGKAIKAHEKTNCVTQFVREAEATAAAWDEKAKQADFKKPPFFGIPISLKECLPYAGYDQSKGFVQELYKPCKQDALLITKTKNLGFVPYVFTNVPQSMLTYNCCNPIYGTSTHPLDATRTPGGSSGGESALLGAGGSIIGIGSDVGGSIRMPCHFCGLSGIKPSFLRFSQRGIKGAVPGRPLINANSGPMTKDVQTTVDFLREVWGDTFLSDNDPYVPPVTWNEELYSSQKKLRIGYYVDDGWFTPHPAVQRAVLEAKDHLEAAGHTVIPFCPPRTTQMMQLFVRALCVDGGSFLLHKMLNDIIEPTLYTQMVLYVMPSWLQRAIAFPLRFIFPRVAAMLETMTLDTRELRQTYSDIEDYRLDFITQMQEDGLDAILCPANVMPAPQHDIPPKLFAATCYTVIFNLLDFGAGVTKVTEVTKKDDDELASYPESDPWYKLAKKSSKDAIGLPIGVQVAAPPYREEIVLRILREIEVSAQKK